MKEWFKKLMKAAQDAPPPPPRPKPPAAQSTGVETAAARAPGAEPEGIDPSGVEAVAALSGEAPSSAAVPDRAAQIEEAQRLVEQNRLAEALEVLGGVEAESPDWPLAQYRRAGILAGLSRVDEALAAVAEAITADGGKAEYLALQGTLCLRSGRSALAEIPLQRAAELGSEDRWTYLNLSYLLHGQKRHDEAVAAIRQGLSVMPDDPALVAHLGRFLLAAGHVDEADRVLAAAAQTHAGTPQVHVFRSWVLRERGDLAGVAAALSRAIELDGSKAEWHAYLARVLVQQGRYAEAAQAAAQAAQLDPANAAVRDLGARAAASASRQAEPRAGQ